jgi:hypothetical protein
LKAKVFHIQSIKQGSLPRYHGRYKASIWCKWQIICDEKVVLFNWIIFKSLLATVTEYAKIKLLVQQFAQQKGRIQKIPKRKRVSSGPLHGGDGARPNIASQASSLQQTEANC